MYFAVLSSKMVCLVYGAGILFAFRSVFFMSFAFIYQKDVTLRKLDDIVFHLCSKYKGSDILQQFKTIRT